MIRRILKITSSLKLTVALLLIGIVLVFAGTWAQIDQGIWAVMSQYFRCWGTHIDFQLFAPRSWKVPGGVPWPGGYSIAVALLVNLLSAHAIRFKVRAKGGRLALGVLGAIVGAAIVWLFHDGRLGTSALGLSGLLAIAAIAYLPFVAAIVMIFGRRSGIMLIHLAIISLIVGEAITSALALETQMPIYEGQTSHWTHDIREVELAVVDHSGADDDRVVVVPQTVLVDAAASGRPIVDAQLPFDIHVDQYMPNSSRPFQLQNLPPQATHGIGRTHGVRRIPQVSGISSESIDVPAAIVTLSKNAFIGRYLLSPHIQSDLYVLVGQTVEVESKTYDLYLRFRRYYKPYSVHLIDFRHDLYTGTKVPRNFSSDIRLVDHVRNEERAVKIYMNHPLRYEGETFFQSGWIPAEAGGPDRGTVLQVVRNPGWTVPYMGCTMGAIGLLIHFGLQLTQFLRRQRP